MRFGSIQRVGMLLALAATCPLAWAMEHVTLRDGSELDCVRHEADGHRVRLYVGGPGTQAKAIFMRLQRIG